MPRFTGVGPRIRRRLLDLGYVRPDGQPDVRKFTLEHRYDKTLFYEWLGDRRTPTKELHRLVADLGVSIPWLLFGEQESRHPTKPRERRPRKSE